MNLRWDRLLERVSIRFFEKRQISSRIERGRQSYSLWQTSVEISSISWTWDIVCRDTSIHSSQHRKMMSIILMVVIIFSYILRVRFLLTCEKCFSSIESCVPFSARKIYWDHPVSLLDSSSLLFVLPLPVYPFFLICTSHNIDSQIVDNESHSDIHLFFMNIEVESLTRNRNELGIQYNIKYREQSYPYQLSEHLLRMSGLTWEWKISRIRNRVVHVIFRKITEIWK